MRDANAQFARRFAAALLALLVVMGAAGIAIDPFWLWQREPYWHRLHGGQSVPIDLRMRFAKSLQLLTRPTGTVIIGSSKVYRTFDMEMLTGGDGYNLGISSLRGRELYGYVDHLLRWRHVNTLVIGLDYFMFDGAHPSEPGYDAAIEKPIYAPEALLASLFSLDAAEAMKQSLRDTASEPGEWHRDGYKATPPFPAATIAKVIPDLHGSLEDVVPDEESYRWFERTLDVAQAHGTKLVLFISPMHRLQFDELRRTDAQAGFDAWRARVAGIAKAHNVPFYDLAHAPFSDEPGIEHGSTQWWLDPSHYSTKGAAWIWQRIGVSAK